MGLLHSLDHRGAHRFQAIAALASLVVLLAAPAHADGTKPYGDNVTARIADRLHANPRHGFVMNACPRSCHAELVRTRASHGVRWVAVVHTPFARARSFRRDEGKFCFAWSGPGLVIPMRHDINNRWREGASAPFCERARWAARRLGWRVHRP